MKTELIQASQIIEKIVRASNRNYLDYLRYLSLANQGVNPFTPEEIELATTPTSWSKLLKKLKK